MKIGLLHILAKNRAAANKDVAGGYGSVTRIGDSFLARVIQNQKKTGDRLPLLSYALYSAIFKKNGHQVCYFENEIPMGMDLVIIHGSIIDFRNEAEFADRIKKHPDNKNTKICFVGPFVSYYHDFFIKHSDFVVVGEPEEFFLELTEIPKKSGIIKTEPIHNLDSLPMCDWSLFDIGSFSYSPLITKKPFLTIQASRGCPFSCSYYCPYTAYQGTKLRQRSIENVINEIKNMKKRYKIKGLLFRDPLFGVNKEYVKQLCKEMVKLNITWGCETRLDLLNENILKLMKRSGLKSINVGIESINEDVLKGVKRKPINTVHQEKILKMCDKLNIKVAAFFILGLPDDTTKTIKQTVAYACSLNTYAAQFSISIPYPGTKYYEEVKNNLLTTDFQDFNASKMVTTHKNFTPKKLFKLREYAYVSYYFRLRYMLKYLKYKILDYI